jgi:hypothetical protein
MPETPLRKPGVWLDRSTGECVLHGADGRRLCVVNSTAAALWELCDGDTTADEMVDAIHLVSSIDVPTVRSDVLRALGELERAGTIIL